MQRIPGLDGIRAFAAVSVVFFHYGGDGWARLQGWVGVQLFFVLSGFLITTLLLREDRVSLGRFYRRRAFRILPVYLVVLAFTVVVTLFQGTFVHSGMAKGMPYYLTLCNDLLGVNNLFGVTWSMGIEEKFYLLWPLILFALCTARRALPVAVLVIGVLLPFSQSNQLSTNYVSILAGCVLALVLHDRRGFAILRPLTHPLVALALIAGFLYVQLDAFGRLRIALGGDARVATPYYALACALLLIGVLSSPAAQRVLDSRPARYVGRRSYALYLCQALAGLFVTWLLPGAGTPQALGTAGIALGMAAVLHRWVELPMIRRGRRTRPAAGAQPSRVNA